eukprot:5334413-Pleurochrysis_carterae.AAC.1
MPTVSPSLVVPPGKRVNAIGQVFDSDPERRMLRRSTTPASLAFAHALAWLPLCFAPAPHPSPSAYTEARATARATFS